jgi:hypothetical protein
MGRKIGFLLLLLGFGASVETTWAIKHNAGHIGIGPEGCRVVGGKFYGPFFTFDDEKAQAVPSGTPIAIVNSFGSVKVGTGASDEVRVKISKRVYQATREEAEAFARRIQITLEEADGGLRISTNREALSREDPQVGFETALEITLPEKTRVAVENAHGPVEVRDVAETRIDSSFDSLLLERVAGRAEVKLRHGDAELLEIGGALTLEARHGNVTVRGVAGASELDTQHGDVRVEGGASLRVKHSHGALTVRNVGGDLDVVAEHSEVDAQNVTGAARIATSFDELRVAEVTGDATLKAEHGKITAREVKGALTATTEFEGVELENVGGPVEVRVEHGGVSVHGLAQGLKVVSAGDEVELVDVLGPIEVRVERGEVSLRPGRPITSPVSIETTHGAIRLDVPEGRHIDLDASARHGDLEVSLPGAPEVKEEGRGARSLVASFGGGGNPVRLRSEGGLISVVGGRTSASN